MYRTAIDGTVRLAVITAAVLCIFSAAPLPVPAAPDDSTLKIGLLSEPPTLNPLLTTSKESKDIGRLVFLQLLDEQPDYANFKPRLAETWRFSADSLTITFVLRPGVRWTDGTPVTAKDIRFTWQLQTDTLVAWPGRHVKRFIRDVEVIDSRTLAFHFSQRYPYQLADANEGVIVPEHVLKDVPREELRNHPFGRNPVGNGPFKMARWEPEQYIELVRNRDYYEIGKPYIGSVVIKFVPDMVTLMTQLKKGEIDLLESIPNDQVPGLEENYPHIRIYKYPSREYWYIAWNLENDLFGDAEVRRALSMAIDREEIIQTLWGGRAEICKSPVHSSLWAFDADIEPIPFDPVAASRTLEKLGWADTDNDGVLDKSGRPFEFEMITNHSYQLRVDIATMTEAYLKKIGIKVNIRTLEFQSVVEKLLSSEYESCVLGWGTETKPDITGHWHSSSVPPNGYNISLYKNPLVDELIDKAKVELSRELSREMWSRAQRIIYDAQPFTFLLIPYEVNALDGRFGGVEPNAISFFYNICDWRAERERDSH